MARPSFEFSNMMGAGFRALTYPAACDDLNRYPVYGGFGSPVFNRSVVPVLAWLAPRAMFSDCKRMMRLLGPFEDSLIQRLDFDQEIILGSGRTLTGFYRALQRPQSRVIEINLPDFAAVKEGLIAEKCRKYNLRIPNLRAIGMDLLKEDLLKTCLREGIEADRDLLVYECGLTMSLPAGAQERLYANVDRLFRWMKRRCILLTSSFDACRTPGLLTSLYVHGMVMAFEKLFRSEIQIDHHAPDAFFESRGYRVVKGGERLTMEVWLDDLHDGLAITGYVWNNRS